MWARFMKAATKEHEASWFQPPPDVVAVEVCRLSGSRPGARCYNASAISATGEISYKSMIYTDYFVRGAEPRDTCAVHAVEEMPYPEPYFAVSAFDDLAPVSPVELLSPEPAPVAAPVPLEVALPPPAPPEAPPGP